MTVTGYLNTSPPNKLGKSITQTAVYNGTLRGECSVMTPVITLQANNLAESTNYFYIAEFNRYYYVQDQTYNVNGLVVVHLVVDPLMSYKNQILNLTGVIERQEKIYDMYLQDPIFRADQQTHTQFMDFESGFSTTPTVLLSTI